MEVRGRAQYVELLGEHDQVSAAGRSLAHQRTRNRKIAVFFWIGVELYGGCAH
jgi:hypothetical protein